MNTQLKNEWIALEKKCQNFLKEKIIQHNKKNSNPLPHPAISSQMTFCKDGVIIKKHKNSDLQNRISVKVFDKTIEEIKISERTDKNLDKNINQLFSPISEYQLLNITEYIPIEIAEKDFSEVLKENIL